MWDTAALNGAFTPEWLERNGCLEEGIEPQIGRENGVVEYTWHWCGETDGDDEIVCGHFIKSASVNDGEWPIMGVA